MQDYIKQLEKFTISSLPDLDVVTLAALELFSSQDTPVINFDIFSRPLVVGSGNAAVTGKLLFSDKDAVFADESSYLHKLNTIGSIDGVFLLSASGGKHAVEIAKVLTERFVPVVLLTTNRQAPAREYISDSSVSVFPKNREPYTYNTSTYMSMILSKTHENPQAILSFIQKEVLPVIPQNFASYDAFYVLIPSEFNDIREMFETKFNELFGPKLKARIFTLEQTKHAKTVVPHDTELFVSFGVENTRFGRKENRIYIPLPKEVNFAALMAIGYVVIGHIQKQFPPYYKENIEAYTDKTSKEFGSDINPIVE